MGGTLLVRPRKPMKHDGTGNGQRHAKKRNLAFSYCVLWLSTLPPHTKYDTRDFPGSHRNNVFSPPLALSQSGRTNITTSDSIQVLIGHVVI